VILCFVFFVHAVFCSRPFMIPGKEWRVCVRIWGAELGDMYSEGESIILAKTPPTWKKHFVFGGEELGKVIRDATVLHHKSHFLYKLVLATAL